MVVGAGLAWALWGGIPDQVEIQAEMVRQGAFTTVTADASGAVTSVEAVPGDLVDDGDVIVRMSSGGGTHTVVSSTAGTVQGIYVEVGAEVAPGDPLASIVDEASSATLFAVSYVDADDAVSLKSLPQALVFPATVDASQYGSLIGRVTFVADVPATQAEMSAALQSQALASAFLEITGGVPYLVIVGFEEPPTWTNDQEPPFGITDGTRADVIATIGVERPIDILFGG